MDIKITIPDGWYVASTTTVPKDYNKIPQPSTVTLELKEYKE